MRSPRHLVALGPLFLSLAVLSGCSSESGCPDDLEFFRTRMWEPVMSMQCIACHKAEGLAGGTRLVLLPPETPGALERNFMTVRALARTKVDGTPLLLLKPSGMHPNGHGGGTLVAQDSTRYADFRTFTERINGAPGICEASALKPCGPGALDTTAKRRLRLLTRFEYDNTLRDLLYVDSKWGQSFPVEEVANGFDNDADARAVSPLLTDKLLAASEQAAEAALENLSRHVSCSPGEECAKEFIQTFGERAFRRPLTDAERTRYQSLYTAVSEEDGYAEGLEAVIAAMLQSPHFLYRSELGEHLGNGVYALTDYEVASELSYLYWGSMPDETLLAKARAGALHTPEQISAEARRMLASPRSRPMLDHFVSQWLELERVDQAQKDMSTYADFTPAIRTAMKAETTALFDHVVRTGSGQLPELFTADYTFVSDGLASFYRLSGTVGSTSTPGTGLRQWDLGGTGRGGILTHGSILASQATPLTSSPVRRGKLVRERLLCQLLPPPPPGLNVQLPPVDPQASNRVRFQDHSRNAACASCHKLMDPIGFGFEQFDSVGRYQPTHGGQPVDASGEVLSAPSPATEGAFTGVDGLQRKLAESPDVQACFSLQWLRFAYGISGDDATCAAQQVTDSFQKDALSIPELLVSLTQLSRFTQRVGEGAGQGHGGAGGAPPTSSNAQVSVSTQDDWRTGYCNTVKVTNTGTEALAWRVTISVEGTIQNAWNAQYTPSGSQVSFVGDHWNAEIAPGASTSFGYCASR
ncbi:DUF1592 domain-containing protein [Archangium sp.]|uniref:DUF1592 domain-containing protein n=1 Tax=Archangium sp. TaxID=1872627 RepID=UPI002EDAB49A